MSRGTPLASAILAVLALLSSCAGMSVAPEAWAVQEACGIAIREVSAREVLAKYGEEEERNPFVARYGLLTRGKCFFVFEIRNQGETPRTLRALEVADPDPANPRVWGMREILRYWEQDALYREYYPLKEETIRAKYLPESMALRPKESRLFVVAQEDYRVLGTRRFRLVCGDGEEHVIEVPARE